MCPRMESPYHPYPVLSPEVSQDIPTESPDESSWTILAVVWSPGLPTMMLCCQAARVDGEWKKMSGAKRFAPGQAAIISTDCLETPEAIGRRRGLLPVPTRYRMTRTWPQKSGMSSCKLLCFEWSPPWHVILIRHYIWLMFSHSILSVSGVVSRI